MKDEIVKIILDILKTSISSNSQNDLKAKDFLEHTIITRYEQAKRLDQMFELDSLILEASTLAASTLARISESHYNVVLEYIRLPSLIDAMVLALSYEAQVATNVCRAIGRLAEGDHNDAMIALNEHHEQPVTFKLTNDYRYRLFQHLLEITNRADDVGQSNLRIAANIAIMKLMKSRPHQFYICTQEVVSWLNWIHYMQDEPLYEQDRPEIDYDHKLLCCNMYSLLKTITSQDALNSWQSIAEVLIAVLKRPERAAQGDNNDYQYVAKKKALRAIGALIRLIGYTFKPYLELLMDVLLPFLTNVAKPLICRRAIGVVADLYSHLLEPMKLYLDQIFYILNDFIENRDTPLDLWPMILDMYCSLKFNLSIKNRKVLLKAVLETCFCEVHRSYDVSYVDVLRTSCMNTILFLMKGTPKGTPKRNRWYDFMVGRYGKLDDVLFYLIWVGEHDNNTDELFGLWFQIIIEIGRVFTYAAFKSCDFDSLRKIFLKAENSTNSKTHGKILLQIAESSFAQNNFANRTK